MSAWSHISARTLAALKSLRPPAHALTGDDELAQGLDGKLARAKEWMRGKGIEPPHMQRKHRRGNLEIK